MKFTALSAVALALTGPASAKWREAEGKQIKYESVPGFFMQDDIKTDPSTFDYASWNFGLLNRTYPTDAKFDPYGSKPQWKRFAHYVKHLNHQKCSLDSERVRYKVLVMGRHGEGWHNAAEKYYGTPAWNCYWSLQNGNGTAVWSDALLTPAGLAEAYKANAYFQSRFEEHGMPYFESYYTSPLSRCIATAETTFGNLTFLDDRPFAPVMKELFRESISIHTCDRRSNKTYIESLSPNLRFEKDFTEFDELWHKDKGETDEHQLMRSKKVLDDVFTNDGNTWLSITSHSGEISKLLATLSHRSFRLATGQIIPVLVKAEIVEPQPTSTFVSWASEATCTSPPITSIGGQGCVCSSTTGRASPTVVPTN